MGESSLKRFALGAATGTPASRISASAIELAGIRTAHRIQSRGHAIRHARLLRQNQGQRAGPELSAPTARPRSGHSRTKPRAIAMESTCTISGLAAGRPLAA